MIIPRRKSHRVSVTRVRDGATLLRDDVVAVEEPLEIRVTYGRHGELRESTVAVTMRTPGEDFELAAGFLFAEGVVGRRQEIREIRYCAGDPQHYNQLQVHLSPDAAFDESLLQRNFYVSSSCGVCGKASLEAVEVRGCAPLPAGTPVVSSEVLRRLPEALREAQAVFERTGGIHAAGLFDIGGRPVCVREDVGRHNAVDKVIGHQFLEGRLPLSEHVLVVSGRTSFEIIQKAIAAGIPVVVAVGAPSSLAVALARQFHLTLAGFTRQDGCNVYAGVERVQEGPAPSRDEGSGREG